MIPFPGDGRGEALNRIREAAESGQLVLDLGDLGLDFLPSELGMLTGLRHLSLGYRAATLTADGRLEWPLDLTRPKAAFTDLRPLSALTGLESLDLSGASRLSDLGPLSPLTELKQLDLYDCAGVSELGPLATLCSLHDLKMSLCESFSDLRPLAALRSLTSLSIYRCRNVSRADPLADLVRLTDLKLVGFEQLADFSFLEGLRELTHLSLSYCHQLPDLGPLAHLNQLKRLEIPGCTRVDSLGPLASLTRLEWLDITKCPRIDSLEPLCGLSDLIVIEAGGCIGITSLAPLESLPRLAVLGVGGTNLDLPDYLVSSRNAPSILAWLRGTVEGVGPSLDEVKLLLVGQGRVGKSHLRRRITGEGGIDYYDGRLDPTQSVDCTSGSEVVPDGHPIGKYSIRLRVWDFGGQNHLHSAHRFFLGGERCFYLLVLAADRPANGEGLDSNRLNYWLRMVSQYGRTARGEKAPVVIVVTRSDELD